MRQPIAISPSPCLALAMLCALVLTALSAALAAQANTEQRDLITIIAFDGDAWYPYMAPLAENTPGKWRKVNGLRNAGEVTHQGGTSNVFFKAEDGRLYTYNLRSETIKTLRSNCTDSAESMAYTQLRAGAQGLAAVELQQGKSRDTEIVAISSPEQNNAAPCTQAIAHPLKQASAQFHPLPSDEFLYYAHVSCRVSCDPIVQEVWRQNRVTGRAEQLTLTNATSYLHSVDSEQRFGYLSSNQRGYYHLARIDLHSRRLNWLTSGPVTDSHPSVSRSGALFFLRRDQAGTQLMTLRGRDLGADADAITATAVSLPADIKKIRYLEVSRHGE